MTAIDQFAAELAIVVNLPIEDDRLRAVFIEDRLAAPPQVDDAEAAHSEANGPVHIDAFIVWPAMLQRGTHPTYQGLVNGTFLVAIRDPCNAAHPKSP